MEREGVPAALGTGDSLGEWGGGVPCPEKHLIQEPGQELTHPLPVSSPSAPGASGAGCAGSSGSSGRTGNSGQMTEPLRMFPPTLCSGRVMLRCVRVFGLSKCWDSQVIQTA